MKYVIANWKMRMTLSDIKSWYSKFSDLVKKGIPDNTDNYSKAVRIIVAPSSIHIPIVKEVFKDLNISLASQDIAQYENGAHTGEVGGFQIKELCEYTIVGHSERRESTETVMKKRDLALETGLTPISCFVSPEIGPKLYIAGSMLAWEDPENISVNGQYRPKDPAQIREGAQKITTELPSDAIFIYGGSVNRDNIKDLAAIDCIDGVLVGNASLDPEHFFEIIVKFSA